MSDSLFGTVCAVSPVGVPCVLHVAASLHCTVGCTATLPVPGSSPLHVANEDTFSSLMSFQVSSVLRKTWMASGFAGLFLFSSLYLLFFF